MINETRAFSFPYLSPSLPALPNPPRTDCTCLILPNISITGPAVLPYRAATRDGYKRLPSTSELRGGGETYNNERRTSLVCVPAHRYLSSGTVHNPLIIHLRVKCVPQQLAFACASRSVCIRSSHASVFGPVSHTSVLHHGRLTIYSSYPTPRSFYRIHN